MGRLGGPLGAHVCGICGAVPGVVPMSDFGLMLVFGCGLLCAFMLGFFFGVRD